MPHDFFNKSPKAHIHKTKIELNTSFVRKRRQNRSPTRRKLNLRSMQIRRAKHRQQLHARANKRTSRANCRNPKHRKSESQRRSAMEAASVRKKAAAETLAGENRSRSGAGEIIAHYARLSPSETRLLVFQLFGPLSRGLISRAH